MTVIRVAEQDGKYSGSSAFAGPSAASRTWAVDTNPAEAPLSSLGVILGAISFAGSTVPPFGGPLETGSDVVSKVYNAREDSDCNHWLLTVDYAPFEFADGEDPETPADERRATLSWSFENYEKSTGADTKDKAYVNSAGDPLDNAPVLKGSYPVLNVTQYDDDFDGVAQGAFNNTINDAAFQGAAAKTLLFRLGGADKEYVEGEWKWTVTYQLVYNVDLWNPVEVLDRGTRVLEGTKRVGATDDNGVLTGKTVLLDGNGVQADPGTHHMLDFDPYKESDFSTIGMRF